MRKSWLSSEVHMTNRNSKRSCSLQKSKPQQLLLRLLPDNFGCGFQFVHYAQPTRHP